MTRELVPDVDGGVVLDHPPRLGVPHRPRVAGGLDVQVGRFRAAGLHEVGDGVALVLPAHVQKAGQRGVAARQGVAPGEGARPRVLLAGHEGLERRALIVKVIRHARLRRVVRSPAWKNG